MTNSKKYKNFLNKFKKNKRISINNRRATKISTTFLNLALFYFSFRDIWPDYVKSDLIACL